MTKQKQIVEFLNNLDVDNLIIVHRDYCDAVNCFDDEISCIEDFEDVLCGLNAFEVACRVTYGDFYPAAPYFRFNAYGNIQSIWESEIYEYIDVDLIADYAVENNVNFDYEEIAEILNSEQEEEQ
jgi:hypothetical protein